MDGKRDRVARHVFVRGRVQGVAFRWYARERAGELGITGWIRNLADGRVEAWCEGPAEALEEMLAWLAKGPPQARVTGTEVSTVSSRGSAGFTEGPGEQPADVPASGAFEIRPSAP